MDARMRTLERRFRASGELDAEVAYLQHRLRVGDVQAERLELAAHAGSRAAAEVLRLKTVVRFGEDLRSEVEVLAVALSHLTSGGDAAAVRSAGRALRKARARAAKAERRARLRPGYWLERQPQVVQWFAEFERWGEAVFARTLLVSLQAARKAARPQQRWRRVDRVLAAFADYVRHPSPEHIRALALERGDAGRLPLTNAVSHLVMAFQRMRQGFDGRLRAVRWPLIHCFNHCLRAVGEQRVREAVREAIVPWALE